MSEPFLAEVRIMGFNFAPRGWAFCDGQILPINQNQSLYSLLGTTYGGDGVTSFALPDFRGRTPIHVGASNGIFHSQGQKSGQETHTLSSAEMPQHRHSFYASTEPGATITPQGNYLAKAPAGLDTYTEPENLKAMHASSVSASGGGQAHENMQPYLALTYCIALQGLFPSRN
ncbi:Phage Tail Collar Domain protein [Pseudovibrio axinellae]|uniref:Phage Tail Collar Domain protein n=1 Tax=Pseudovibrio axinellae TaxID=989403 RepID=A0A165UPQ8_9HYPH|nr:tail fiber protein [Pseudovibrio axinellae]KZL12671.1 Phage Tail Collar Domain protein [Pseudovibrio axinellae]SEP62143.1 Microcystin-dependent protein [Pseudovibrio axinellae]